MSNVMYVNKSCHAGTNTPLPTNSTLEACNRLMMFVLLHDEIVEKH